MPIGRHLLRNMANDNNGLPKKPFGGGHVLLFTQQRIDHIAFPIDGTVEVTPRSIHFDVRFVFIPGSSCLPTSLRPQLLGNKGSESCFPNPDCFMCERKAALEKHVSEITQTQLGAQSPEHNEKNKIGGIFEKVERGVGTFMKDMSARWAEEGSRAKFRFLRSLPGRGYCAIGTMHWFRLPFSIFYLEKDNRSMTPCQGAVSVLTEPQCWLFKTSVLKIGSLTE